MNKKLVYFLRSKKSFDEFTKYYNLNIEICKNEPIFEYKINNIIASNADFLLLTSRMALDSLVLSNFSKEIPLILVGKSLARLAIKYGFSNILYIAENIRNIIEFLSEEYKNKKIIYLRGNYITLDIKNILYNFNIIEEFAYNIYYKNTFNSEFISNLKIGHISKIIFFSNKSAEEFLRICLGLNLTCYLLDIAALSLGNKSEKILKIYFNSYKDAKNGDELYLNIIDGM